MNDLIKREDAIRAFNKATKGIFSDKHLGETIVGQIPSADRWIPCSERLPQIGQKVLASTKKTVFTQVFKGYYSDPTRWEWQNNSAKKIEAWQPLPKPWEGAEDDTD